MAWAKPDISRVELITREQRGQERERDTEKWSEKEKRKKREQTITSEKKVEG